jgi:iron complex outermembrane receptor protein
MENYRMHGDRLLAVAIALTLATAAHTAHGQQAEPTTSGAPTSAAPPTSTAPGVIATEQEPSGGLEEILVTATKRVASSQDVPIAISAISADALESAHVNDVRALQNLAPGLVLSNPAGFNATGGGMRGTGTNIILVTQDAPVSFLMDEFALSHVSSQFLTIFDTQQVEVYRGPQGTLFGKNTTGGVIAITSKPPVLGEYSIETQLSYGQYDNGAGASSVQAAVNLPFSDTLAMRIAAIYDTDDGFYTDDKNTATFPNNVPLWGLFGIAPGTPIPSEINTNTQGPGGRLGGKDVLATKIKLLWEPNDWYSAYLIGELVKDRSDSPPGVNESIDTDLLTGLGFPGIALAGESDPFSTLISHNTNMAMDAGHKVDTEGVYLTQSFQVLSGEIKSITGYRKQVQRFPSTYTGESFLTLFDSTRNTERYTTQQEIRYVSDFDGPFNFVTGGNYFHDSFNNRAMFSVGLTSLIPNLDADTGTFVRADGRVNLDTRALFDYQFQGASQSRDEYAVFWDGTYDLTDAFRLTAGLRYSRDEKEFLRYVDGGGPCTALTDPLDVKTVNGECTDTRSQYTSRAGILPNQYNGRTIPLPLSAYGNIVDADDEWSKTTWRVVADYKPGDFGMFYLSYATGFLSGGFSETCATPTRCAYDPETNDNIELGYKADVLDNTLRLNAAVYVTNYDNLQRAVVATYTAADGTAQQETVTVNTGSSEATGVDLEATWVPTDQWKVGAAINWLDHKYGSGSCLPNLRGDNPDPTSCDIDLTQFNLPFSPEWKAGLDVSRDFDLVNGGVVTLNGNVNYQSEAETDVFNGPNTQMEERTVLGAAATYEEPDGRWSATLYGTNLTDEVFRVAALPVAGLWNFTNYGAPRQIGVSLNMKFD